MAICHLLTQTRGFAASPFDGFAFIGPYVIEENPLLRAITSYQTALPLSMAAIVEVSVQHLDAVPAVPPRSAVRHQSTQALYPAEGEHAHP